jgi:hypothetical protein
MLGSNAEEETGPVRHQRSPNQASAAGLALRRGGASERESMNIPAGLVPAQSDHLLGCGISVCIPSSAQSFALRRVPAGIEFAPVHHQPDGKDGHRSGGDRVARETESHSS